MKTIKAQSEIESINKTIYEYIEGTVNGEPERVSKAFQADFQLFLISADTLRIIDGKQYIANIEKGKKYNRIAIDYMLLLRMNENWKIVHKSFTDKDFKLHPN